MATEKLGESILKSRLGSLTKDFEGVKKLLDELTDAASGFGTTLTHSIRSAKGELHGLESVLKGLETQLKRTSTTGSAIGAANISASLGQLTGQGRGGGGGGGYGPGGGGGLTHYGLGGGGDASPQSLINAAINKLPSPFKQVARAAKGWGGLAGGMAWSAMKQSYGVRQKWEQAARYTRGLRGATDGGGIAGLARLGVSQFEGAHTLRQMQSRLGYSRSKGAYDIANVHGLSQSSGIEPEEWMSMWERGRTGGMKLPEGYNLSRGLLMGARADAATDAGSKATKADVFARAQYIARARKTGVEALMAQQVAGTGRMAHGNKMVGFVRSLDRGAFRGREQIGAQMAGALGAASAAPGGGEAGQLFMMRAAGFGNPMLEEYRKNAKAMGVDPSMFQRRNFLESKLFLEADPVRRIQAMMVGVKSEYGPGRGTGYKESQVLALESLAGKEGVTFTLAKQLMDAASSGQVMSTKKIKELAAAEGVVFGDQDKLPGDRPLGALSLTSEQMSKYEAGLISMSGGVAAFGEAITNFEIEKLELLGKHLNNLSDEFRALKVSKGTVKTLLAPVILLLKLLNRDPSAVNQSVPEEDE